MCGQPTAYNAYATLPYTNPLFMGFSRSQNVNKEIIREELMIQLTYRFYIPLQSTISTNQLGIQPRFFLASLIRDAISEGAFRWTEALHFWQSKETWIFASMLASTLPVSWIYIAKITLNISRFFRVKKCLFGV